MRRLIKLARIFYLPLSVLFIGAVFTGAFFSNRVSVSGVSVSMGNWATPTPGKVIISEVLYNPVDTGTDTGHEWVEVYNSGGSPITLTGYDLFAADHGYYTFPSYTLASHGLVVVHIKTNGTDTATDLYTGTGGGTNMSDTSGSIALFTSSTHSSSTIVDYVEYGAGGQTWQSAAVSAGIWTANAFVPNVAATHSIELINKTDTNQVSDWQDQSMPTPGS